MTDLPLWEKDPDAWQRHLAEGNATQPRKRVAADVILRNPTGEVLLVDPTYKPDWDLPGGMAEANEPPHHTAQRELTEELGLHIELKALLCVDWVQPHGPWDDTIIFVFNGGTLTPAQISGLQIRDTEIATYQFCTPHHAATLLRPHAARRLQTALHALNTNTPQYLHNGKNPWAPNSG